MTKRVCPNGHITKDRKALKCSQCGADLPPPAKPKRWPIVVGVLAVLLLCGIVATATQKGRKETAKVEGTPAAAQAESAKPAVAAKPTGTPTLTATPRPSSTPSPSRAPTRTPEPVVLKGSGQTATEKFRLPYPISVAHFTHNGSSNFIVEVFVGDAKDLLINTIGPYDGQRPLAGEELMMLSIIADGAWTAHIEPIQSGGAPAFQGRGDKVSALFTPPATGAWEITHDGQDNFIVYCHCAGGSDLIQNEIGDVSGSQVISFPKGPCFWEVRADGDWSLKPRQ